MATTIFSAINGVKHAVQVYRDRTREANEIYNAIRNDRRMSHFAIREAGDKKLEKLARAEAALRENLKMQRAALATCETDRAKIETLGRENLNLLETLAHIDASPDDYVRLAKTAAAENNLTMCKALAKSARAQGITLKGFDNPLANIDKMDSLIKAVDIYLKNPEETEVGLDEIFERMLAETDPTAPRPEIEAFYTPDSNVDAELVHDVRQDWKQQQQITAEQNKAFLKGAEMDTSESDLQAQAQAAVDISTYIKAQKAAEKAEAGDGSEEEPDGSAENV